MQLCQMCAENEDIVLLKVDWDQNKPIARPLGVKVSPKLAAIRCCFFTCAVIMLNSCVNSWSLHASCNTEYTAVRLCMPISLASLSVFQNLASLERH